MPPPEPASKAARNPDTMTARQKTALREWGPIIAVLIQLSALVVWGARLDARVDENRHDVERAVPRSEYNLLLQRLDRIENKLDRIAERPPST